MPTSAATARGSTITGAMLALTALFALTACFTTPDLTPTPGASDGPRTGADELIDTTWAGTDSDGIDWAFTFQEDGTVAVTYSSEAYDDPADVWTVTGNELVIQVDGGDALGEVLHIGEYTALDAPIELDVRSSVGDFTWTIVLERQ